MAKLGRAAIFPANRNLLQKDGVLCECLECNHAMSNHYGDRDVAKSDGRVQTWLQHHDSGFYVQQA